MKKDDKLWLAFIVYFLFVPCLLILLFLFSDYFDRYFLLNVLHPTALSIIGSNYLHTDMPHLLSNLTAYLLVMTLIFFFDYHTNRKMLFMNILLLFILLPITSSLLNILSFTEYGVNLSLKGFSAITAGYFGYLAYSVLHYIRNRYRIVFNRSLFQLMWLIIYVNLAMISLVYGYHFIAIIIFFLIVLTLINTYRDCRMLLNLLGRIDFLQRTVLLFGLSLSVLAVVPALFPGNLQYDGSMVNIFAHYIGYIFGFAVPAIISEYVFKNRIGHAK